MSPPLWFLLVLLLGITLYHSVPFDVDPITEAVHEEKIPFVVRLENFHPFERTQSDLLVQYFEELHGSREQDMIQIADYPLQKDIPPELFVVLHNIYMKREKSMANNPKANDTRVQIVGAGTVGLIYALEAYEAGSTVTIIEKSTNYTRNIWFDVYGMPWFHSLEKLQEWVYSPAELLDAIIHGDRVISVRAQLLERYLSSLLFYLNVPMYYGYSFLHVDPQDRKKIIITGPNGNPDQIHLPFDVLLAADGSRSSVRSAMDIMFDPVTKATVGDQQIQLPEHMSQLAFVIRIQPDENGECPKESRNEVTGDPVLPWDITFQLPGEGIMQVYKRFFHNYCELQLFFDDETGTRLSRNREEIDWPFILRIVNQCVHVPYPSISALQMALKRRSIEGEEFDFDFVNVAIRQASQNVKIIENNHDSSSVPSIVLLMGDAAVSSHFRLGIGINAAFEQLPTFRTLIDSLSSDTTESFHSSIEEYKTNSKLEQTAIANFEVLSIFYEAYCDYIVFIDPMKEDTHAVGSMIVFGKDYSSKDYNLEPHTTEEILQLCHKNIN